MILKYDGIELDIDQIERFDSIIVRSEKADPLYEIIRFTFTVRPD